MNIKLENIYGVIYKITNKINGKIYIGQTVDLNKRISAHKKNCNNKSKNLVLYAAMRKHNFDNFKFEEIDSAFSKEELDDMEKFWIKFYKSNDGKHGYNMTAGGTGGAQSKQIIEKSNKIKKENLLSGKTKRRREWGLKLTEASKRKIGLANSGSEKGVYCLELNRVFLYIEEAALFFKTTTRSIHQAACGISQKCKKNTFIYYDREKKISNEELKIIAEQKNNYKRKEIICVESGKIFSSSFTAGKFTNQHGSNIILCCLKPERTCGGFHWKYADKDKAEGETK